MPTLSTNTPALSSRQSTEKWDDRCVGWRGLWSRLSPFVALVVLFLYSLFYVLWIHRQTLNLGEGLKFALALPTALLVFGLPQIRGLLVTVRPQDTTTDSERRLAGWIRKGAMASLLIILVHISFPEGETKHVIGSLAASMFVALVISIGLGQKIVILMEESEARRRSDTLPLPPKAPTHGWIRDMLIWFVLAFVAVILTLFLRVTFGLDNRYSQNLTWCTIAMALYFTYYVVGISYRGGTIGQRKAGSSVVRQTTGNRVSVARTSLRALLLIVPVYCLLAYSSVASVLEEHSDPGFIYQILELSAIVSLLMLVSFGVLSHVVLRDVHPRGQGFADLFSGTLSVSTRKPDVERRT